MGSPDHPDVVVRLWWPRSLQHSRLQELFVHSCTVCADREKGCIHVIVAPSTIGRCLRRGLPPLDALPCQDPLSWRARLHGLWLEADLHYCPGWGWLPAFKAAFAHGRSKRAQPITVVYNDVRCLPRRAVSDRQVRFWARVRSRRRHHVSVIVERAVIVLLSVAVLCLPTYTVVDTAAFAAFLRRYLAWLGSAHPAGKALLWVLSEGFKLHPQLCELLSGAGNAHATLLAALPAALATAFLRLAVALAACAALLHTPAEAARLLHASLAALSLVTAGLPRRAAAAALTAQARGVRRLWAVLRGRAPLPSLRDRLWAAPRADGAAPLVGAQRGQGVRATVAAALLLMPLVLLLPTMAAFTAFYTAAALPWGLPAAAARLAASCLEAEGRGPGDAPVCFEVPTQRVLVTEDGAPISFRLARQEGWVAELRAAWRAGARRWWRDARAGTVDTRDLRAILAQFPARRRIDAPATSLAHLA